MQTVTVELSEQMYRRLQRAAEIAGKPIDEMAAQSLQESLPPLLDVIPPPFRADLQAMERLSDDELWQISRSQVEANDRRRWRRLMNKSHRSILTDRERQALVELRAAIDKVMFRKAYAYLLLKWRGHRVPTLPELESRP